MAEIELKITHLSKADILEKLKEIGAIQHFPETLVTDIFYAQKKNEITGSSQTVRLRHMKDTTVLTAKRKRAGGRFKVMEETELQVENLPRAQKLLQTLGFRVTSRREKLREEYHYQDVIIEIDTYPGMKPYMEIEAKNKLSLLRFLKAFGLSITQTNNLSAKEIILKARKNPDHITFSSHDNQLPHHQKQTTNRGFRNHPRRQAPHPATTQFSGRTRGEHHRPKNQLDN